MNQVDELKLKAIENVRLANENAEKAAKFEQSQKLIDQLMTLLRENGIQYEQLLTKNDEDEKSGEPPAEIQKLDLDDLHDIY